MPAAITRTALAIASAVVFATLPARAQTAIFSDGFESGPTASARASGKPSTTTTW